MSKGIKRQIKIALKNVDQEIKSLASREGKFAGGLALEGYAGGYRQALYDVQLALNSVNPHSRFWYYEELNQIRDE